MSGAVLGQVIDQREALGGLVAELDADAVPVGEAPDIWQAFDGIERLASAAKTLLARRVDESGVWQREGHRRAADYLAKRSGSSVGAARAGLETSKKLRCLPRTQQALRRGELSRSQAESIVDAAVVNPDAERSLLGAVGRLSLGELRERCGRAKANGDRDREATHRRLRRERRLRRYTDSAGAWNLVARGTPDDGALFNTVLDPILDQIFQAARRNGDREPHQAYGFDALIELARRARAGGDHARPVPAERPATGPDPDDVQEGASDAGETTDLATDPAAHTTTPAAATDVAADPDAQTTMPAAHVDAPEPSVQPAAGSRTPMDGRGTGPGAARPAASTLRRRAARTDPTHLALLRVDLEALVRGATEGDELCEVTGVGPIPVSVARRLLGDSVLKLVITKGVDVLNVTHLGRGPTAAQRIALLWQSPGCIVEGCPNRRVEIDHRIPWAQTRHTCLGELDPLCGHCHDLKTTQGWALVPGHGPRPLVPPDDPRHPADQPSEPSLPTDGGTSAGPETTDTGPPSLLDNSIEARDAA